MQNTNMLENVLNGIKNTHNIIITHIMGSIFQSRLCNAHHTFPLYHGMLAMEIIIREIKILNFSTLFRALVSSIYRVAR